MAIFSPLRSRRFANRHTEATSDLIAFPLHQEWFALFIHNVIKVVPLAKVYGDPKKEGVALTVYQDQELLVIDVDHRIFQDPPSPDFINKLSGYLLIVQNSLGEFFGIPINSPPTIKKVPESSFQPLPSGYMTHGNIHCLSSRVIQLSNQPPLFLLDPDLIYQSII